MSAEPGGEDAIEWRRNAAALQMAQNGDARVHTQSPADGLGDVGADAPVRPHFRIAAELIFLFVLLLGLVVLFVAVPRLGLRPLGDGDDAEPFAASTPFRQVLADAVDVVGNLRYQNNIGPAGDPRGEGSEGPTSEV